MAVGRPAAVLTRRSRKAQTQGQNRASPRGSMSPRYGEDANGSAKVSRAGKNFIAAEAVTHSTAYDPINLTAAPKELPNMLFVPLKTREPVVQAREFAVFLLMLLSFTVIHSQQNFGQDFVTNSGMADVANINTDIVGFVNVATLQDYAGWWPSLAVALTAWKQNREHAVASNATDLTALPTVGSAFLLGKPLIMQRRLAGAAVAFNSTAGHECPWAPRDYDLGLGPTCYGSPMSWTGTDPLMGADGTPGGAAGGERVMYLDHIEEILGAGSAWSPTDWIDADTTEIVHYFQVWLPMQQRLATAKIAATFDPTGRVQPKDADGKLPTFRSQEPFPSRTNEPAFYGELVFYCVIAYYLLLELLEVWDCMCLQELLLPLEILVDSFRLSLYEITYFHAKTSEVYDPRDPNTGAAFTFPDTQDLEDHLKLCIMPIQDTLRREDEQLKDLRAQIADLDKDARRTDKESYNKRHDEAVALHMELMKSHEALDDEIELAETAAILQLAVMWHNRWSMDFPPGYLREIGNPRKGEEEIDEDGEEAFKAINWIRVATDYTEWTGSGLAHETVAHLREGGVNSFKTHRLGILGDHPMLGLRAGAPLTAQQKHFTKVAPLADYLNMLRDTLSLHQQLVAARSIKYWNGPRMETSHTIDGAFQDLIKGYNEVGYALKEEMQSFPEEILNGYHDPNLRRAETTKINARRVQKDLITKITTAQALGLFFPGSTLWELRRKLRGTGKYDKAANFKWSLTTAPEDATIVGSASMNLYLQADETAGADYERMTKPISSSSDEEEDDHQRHGAATPNRTKRRKRKRNTTVGNPGKVSNPMLEMGLVESYDENGPEDEDSIELQLLKQVPFLSELSREQLVDMAAGCDVIEYGRDSVIIEEGDTDCLDAFVLIKGNASVYKKGTDRPLTRYTHGELFGEQAIKEGTRIASVIAEGDATCLKLNASAIKILSRSSANEVLDGTWETTAHAVRINGTPGWRDWVPHSARQFVNHDGQFFSVDSGMIDKLSKSNMLYPLWLYFSEGVASYWGNGWNVIEFWLYTSFMVAGYCKIQIWRMEPFMERAIVQALNGDVDFVDVVRFDTFSWLYMVTLAVNGCVMWIKLLKYIDCVPQMGILIDVLSKAVPSVTIFTLVAIIPVLGLAYSYTAVFGDSLYRYSTVWLSLNTILLMSVGDFNFEELFAVNPASAVLLFWLSALLIVFVLINIFVAIILNAYDLILQANPDANDSAQFVSTVIMEAKRMATGALGTTSLVKRQNLEPHVLVNDMEGIESETYWDVFEGYFALGGHGIDKAMREHAAEFGGTPISAAGASASAPGSEAVDALDAQLQHVKKTVDGIAAKQQSYEQQTRDLVAQQREILTLLKAMHAKVGNS